MDDTVRVQHAGKRNWFRDEQIVFQSAIRAVQTMLPPGDKNGLELTCSAEWFPMVSENPRLIRQSLTNTTHMHDIRLPFENLLLDYVFISYCDGLFGGDTSSVFKEVYRILKSNGQLIVAFIDAKSPDGKEYVNDPEQAADAERIMFDLTGAGFRNFEFAQTLFSSPEKIKEIQDIKPGFGEGAFVIVQAYKKM